MRLLAAVAVLAAVPAVAQAVVGGRAVSPTSVPWMAALPDCGATLVAPDRIVTAAHCVNGLGPADLARITFGDGTVRSAARIGVHPGYVRRALDGTANRDAPRDDIAIVQLDRAVTIKPVTLASKVSVGTRARVLGRGFTSPPPRARGAAFPPGLRAAELRVSSDTTCRRFYARASKPYRGAFHSPTMLCASDPSARRRPQRSACVRDSGGPLVAGTRLLGVVSWGERCGAERDPTVFTPLNVYRGFVSAAQPVWAPVAGAGPVTISGDGVVGATLTCTAPAWVTAPDTVSYTWSAYRFMQGNPTRQSGASTTYVVREQDRGRSIQCTVNGATKGGVTSLQTATGPRVPS